MARPRGKPRKPKPVGSVVSPDQQDRRREAVVKQTPPDQQDRQRAHREKKKPKPKPVTPPDQQDRQRAARTPPPARPVTSTPPDQQDRQQAVQTARTPPDQQDRQRVHRADPAIVSRQRRLRAEGYPVAVDGQWGPTSQKYWSQFKKEGRFNPPPTRGEMQQRAIETARKARDLHGYDQIENNRVRAANEQMIQWAREPKDPAERLRRLTKLRKSGAPVARGEIKSARRATAHQEVQRRRTAALAEATKLRDIITRDPQAIRKFKLEDLATLVLDPEAGSLDTANPRDVLLIQRWLTAHGRPVTEDGKFGTETARALEAAVKASERETQQGRVQAVTRRYYSSGVLRPGAVLPGFPLGGKVPAPGELLKVLDQGGFTAAAVARWIETEYRRRGHLNVDPEYKMWRAELLRRSRQGLFGPFDKMHYLPRASGPVYIGSPQMGEVYAARNFPELERRLLVLERQEEKTRMAAIAKEADKPWWRDALEKSVLGDDVLDAALGAYKTTEALLLGHARVSIDGGYISSHGFREADLAAEESLREFRDKHPWLYMGLELAADPVNYLPAAVFVAPFRGARAGILELERVGIKLSGSGRLGRAPLVLASPAKGYRGIGDGYHAWVDGMRLYTAKALATDPAALNHAQRAFRRATISVRRGTALREAMGRAVVARVKETAKMNFKTIPVSGTRVAQKTTGDPFGDISGKVTAKTRQELDVSIEQLAARMDDVLPNVLPSLSAAKASLYAGENASEYTTIGWQMVARLKEGARERVAKDISSREANKHAQSVASRQGQPGTAAYYEAYDEAYREMYRLTLARFGSHFAGITDPALAGALAWQMRDFDDLIELVLMPAVQRRLMQGYEHAGIQLWDETGLWASRQADEQALARFAASASISGKTRWIDNPIVGQVFRRTEAHAFIQDEISRRTASLYGWASVRRAAGETIDDAFLEKRVDEIVQEVRNAWADVPGGLTDSRKQIEVPEIYSRFTGEVAGSAGDVGETYVTRALEAGLDPASPGALLALSMPNEAIRGGGRMGPVRIPDALAFDTDIRRTLGHLAFTLPEKLGDEAALPAELVAFRTAARARHEAVKRGITEVSAHAYRQEGAWMEAIRYAQTKPLRVIYWGLVGATSTWKFATLALRPAWTVRNVLDNATKVMLESKMDPRVLLAGYKSVPGEHIRSVIALDIAVLRDAARFLDKMMGTNAAAWFDHAINVVWSHDPPVLRHIFLSHGVDIPEKVGDTLRIMAPGLEEGVTKVELDFLRDAARKLGQDPSYVRDTMRRMRDGIWNLTGTRPEAYFRRALYRSTAERAIARGIDEDTAAVMAWQAVERTLFDYSRLRVVDDNFKVFFPFLQWWRKNAAYWTRTAVTKPWFTLSVLHFDQARRETKPEWPEWMTRYVHVDDVSDAVSRVPGIGDWLAHHVQRVPDLMADPMNYLSFAPMYRTFKEENPNLPPDKQGWAFISDLVDFASDIGLASNPLVRKPLEWAGVLNYRAWQRIFPQTDLIAAGTRKFWHERFGNSGLDLESLATDYLFNLIGTETQSEILAERFNEFVQIEMAGQQLRGETPNRALAEEKIRDYLLIQSLFGYISGVYPRRMTPEDFHLYDMADEFQQGELDYLDLSEDEQQAYQLFKRRRLDPVSYDRRAEMVPMIQAYYRQPDYDAKEAFKQAHPEVIPHVEQAWTEPLRGSSWIHTQMLVQDTQAAADFWDFRDTLNLKDRDVYEAAERAMVSPELRNFWKENDTPKDVRRGLIAGAYHGHLKHLSDTFFALPEGDWEAREKFLADNPALQRWWDEDNEDGDDYSAMLGSAKADLRDRYFEIVKEQGFGAAAAFFRQFPFIFEGTASEDRINPDGTWAAGGGGGDGRGGRGQSQHAKDYLAARKWLTHYFSLPKEQRGDWLAQNGPGQRVVRAYFAKYSHGAGGKRGRSQHAKDYLAARRWLKLYFGMSEAQRDEWLEGKGKGQRIVKAYFAKYAHTRGTTQHSKDYLAVKNELKHYFALTKSDRAKWLHGGSPAARKVLAYFKKYGKNAKFERKFKMGLQKWVQSKNPEIRQRLLFWQRYFALEPDQRPAFVHAEAEKYGVFVYGPRSEAERHRRGAEWLRQALAAGLTKKAALYLRIKPLLDVFFTLKGPEKELFLRANSEVAEYLDASRGDLTKDPRVNAILERYFKLPFDSPERTAYLRAHPEVQRYFDARATPAERALHRLLEGYFDLPMGDQRKGFLMKHPEVEAYFDKKDAEMDLLKMQAAAFDLYDPRLAASNAVGDEWDAEVALKIERMLLAKAARMYAAEIADSRAGRRTTSEGRSNLAL